MSLAQLILALALALGPDRPPPAPPGATAAPPASALRSGDLVFQSSRSAQSAAVGLATGSALTHMGVVFLEGDRPWVLEAVEPVRRTPYDAWRRRGVGGRVWAKRLRDADAVLTLEAVARMRALGAAWLGRPYDLRFRWDDDRLYCSELAHKLFARGAGVALGRLQRAGELSLDHPVVRRTLQERFGATAFDPAEPVVTPQAIFDDPRLLLIGQP